MSHVDDGMLHAYLDGGLSALDAVRVERHVADCAPCRQRLDAARALVQRAARLLEWASPPAERAAPPLAELRPYTAPRWQVPVAWAATIVLALGAGAYGGQLIFGHKREVAESKQDVAARDERDPRAAPITIVADSPILPVPPPRNAEGGIQQAAPQPPAPTTTPAGPPPAAPAPATTPPAAKAAEAPATAQSRDSIAKNQMADVAAKARSDSEAVRDAAAELRREATPTALAGTTSANAAGARAPSAAFNAPLPGVITADSARVLLGTSPLALLDYPITGIRVRDGAVTVEQVIPPGRVLRLVQRRVSTEEAERATEQLARYVDGLRVEISGPMAADSLSRLLERARGIP